MSYRFHLQIFINLQVSNEAASNLHETVKRLNAFRFFLDFIKNLKVQEYLSIIHLDIRKEYH